MQDRRRTWCDEMKRTVGPATGFEEEVLKDFLSPSTRCVAGADLLLEELEKFDPDLDERCGLLADRHEVYALNVTRCRHLALVVSLDIVVPRPWPCTVHGLLPRSGLPCETGRQKAERHFNLTNPSWEPA